MTTKEQIIQALDRMPESSLQKVLAFTKELQFKANSPEAALDEQAWQAYLESEQEREEVYRRLANS
ncbi:MAG TPA: hypothetical protein V6D10_03060 [Trichocoleus sp.]|jgi:hypothetical protein